MGQDHRGIKKHYYPMSGFGSFTSSTRFNTAHDERRDHLCCRQHMNNMVSLGNQRRLFHNRWSEVYAGAAYEVEAA